MVLRSAFCLFDRSRSFNARPHGSELRVRNDCCHIKVNPIALDPRAKVSPHFANVTGFSNGYTTAADRFTNAVLQFETIEFVPWASGIDVVGKAWAGLPSSFNSGETPDDQVMLQGREPCLVVP